MKISFNKKVRYYEELLEYIKDYLEEEYNDDLNKVINEFETV
jgi:hypothetical protein